MGPSNLGSRADVGAAGRAVQSKARNVRTERSGMPRYVVERMFPQGLGIPAGEEGARRCLDVVERNADEGVTWVLSYVSQDRLKTFCFYEGPSPEAIRKTAARNDLPVDRITQICVLDPYFYT